MTTMTRTTLEGTGRRKTYHYVVGADGDTSDAITHGFPTSSDALAKQHIVPIVTPNNAKGALADVFVTLTATTATVDRGVTASTATGEFDVTLWYIHSIVE